MAVLNGNSLAIIIALLPASLTTGVIGIIGVNDWTNSISVMTNAAQSILPVLAAFAVAHALRMGTLEAASMGLATFVSSGVLNVTSAGMMIKGTGSILNIMLMSFVSTLIVLGLRNRLGAYKMIVLPTVTLLIGGLIGQATLPSMIWIQNAVGQAVSGATSFTPVLMGLFLGAAFAFLITSPLSSVGIATAISLVGIGSGAANVGIATAALMLAIMGYSVNAMGATLAHVIGSPKIQLANLIRKPILYLPIMFAGGIGGALAAVLKIQGTAFSAGFGFSGLIGPITAWNITPGNDAPIRIVVAYLVVTVLGAVFTAWLFIEKLHLVAPDDLKLLDED
ncbi:PTS sugar transporter subunit IIC [Weissella diestrammenae]|nr:PTS sugar transporter subunit IIC [Weissella diestrammenae]